MNKTKIKSIGTVMPLGDGATGKSLLAKHLQKIMTSNYKALLLAQSMKKSLNLEIGFGTRTFEFENEIIDTTVQYYTFPGQKKIEYESNRTFEYIAETFSFLPALRKVAVLLLVYDTTRSETLKSLEYWINAAISKNWIHEKTKIILVANKTDILSADENLNESIVNGIFQMLIENNIKISKNQVSSVSISALTLKGINELRDEIFEWVMSNGKRLDRIIFG